MSQETGKEYSQISETGQKIFDYIRDTPRLRLSLLIGPPLFALIVFFLMPLLSVFWLSFQTQLPPGAEITMQNYQRIVRSSVYFQIIWDTVVITIQTTIFVVAIGYSLAYSIVRFSKRTTGLMLLVILPFWTNYIIRMYAWINILQNGGALSFVLITLGITQQPTGYLYTHNAVLVGFIYIWLPLATLPFYASVSNIDENLIEAAKDLGSGPIKTFLTITLPITKDGIIAGVILVAIPTFGSFITPTLLGGTKISMIGVTIANQFKQAFNWPFGSALGVFVALVVVALLGAGVKAGGDLYGAGGEG